MPRPRTTPRPRTKQNRTKQNRTKKRTTRRRPKHGGRVGNNTVDVYLIAYPGSVNHDRIMYYVQQNHADTGDMLNTDFVEDLMETMIKSDPPLVAYKKTIKTQEKKD